MWSFSAHRLCFRIWYKGVPTRFRDLRSPRFSFWLYFFCMSSRGTIWRSCEYLGLRYLPINCCPQASDCEGASRVQTPCSLLCLVSAIWVASNFNSGGTRASCLGGNMSACGKLTTFGDRYGIAKCCMFRAAWWAHGLRTHPGFTSKLKSSNVGFSIYVFNTCNGICIVVLCVVACIGVARLQQQRKRLLLLWRVALRLLV